MQRKEKKGRTNRKRRRKTNDQVKKGETAGKKRRYLDISPYFTPRTKHYARQQTMSNNPGILDSLCSLAVECDDLE